MGPSATQGGAWRLDAVSGMDLTQEFKRPPLYFVGQGCVATDDHRVGDRAGHRCGPACVMVTEEPVDLCAQGRA